ncbi:GNAT family N-acetyltransferase [Streptomyces sp. SID13031]|uniref:GNAT family N-acetyltransferase n=1 Tax=Streptomyces sp. SID13031 TaxID=2706046 RepID=UPI0013C87D84|nr:GNAT family N-acetyltransferase [Streptomyces sp. SID13031]NEA32255.1 GNAT family N-acetyltransferase [Streptomyces sp. SID13031]
MDDAEPTESDTAELIRAIEDNAAELLLAMGAAGGGRQRADGVQWSLGGSPLDYHNAVVSCVLDGGEAADRVVADSLQELKDLGIPGSWHVGPSMRPLDLGDRLLAAGFSHGGSEPGMALRLTELREAEAAGLRVERVTDVNGLATWAETLGQGFGEGVKEARWVAEVYRRLGVADPWRHYLGYLDGKPVATVTVFLASGVAGVYFVMTVPAARRRGIGAAITAAVLREARDSGLEAAVLGSSPAGRSVYTGLGFRELCTIDLYEWSPS